MATHILTHPQGTHVERHRVGMQKRDSMPILVRLAGATLATALVAGPVHAGDLDDILRKLVPGQSSLLAPATATRPGSPGPGNVEDAGLMFGVFTPSVPLSKFSKQTFQEFDHLPQSSSPSSFTYAFDPQQNSYVRTRDDFGPILADRANTLGKGKLNLGFNWAHIDFDEFEGQNLNHVRLDAPLDFATGFTDSGGLAPPENNSTIVFVSSATSIDPNDGIGFTLYDDAVPGLDFGGGPGSATCPAPSGDFCNLLTNGFEVRATGPAGDYAVDLGAPSITVDTHMEVELFNVFASYGVTDWLDLSLVLPILEVDYDVKVKIDRPAIDSESLIGFPNCDPDDVDCQVFAFLLLSGQVLSGNLTADDILAATGSVTEKSSDGGSDAGIGDLLLRAKASFLETQFIEMAGRLDASFPTGSEDNFRGTGEYMVGFHLVASKSFRWFSPHANAGFLVRTGGRENHQFRWALGAEARLHERVTAAFDFLGSQDLYHDGVGDTQMSVAPGLKLNPWRTLVVSGAAVIRVNHQGLRADVVPTLAVEYTFF